MRKNHIHLPVALGKNSFNTLLQLSTWLLVNKPRQTVFAPPELIDAVRSPDRNSRESFYVIDLSIHGKRMFGNASSTMTTAPKRSSL